MTCQRSIKSNYVQIQRPFNDQYYGACCSGIRLAADEPSPVTALVERLIIGNAIHAPSRNAFQPFNHEHIHLNVDQGTELEHI